MQHDTRQMSVGDSSLTGHRSTGRRKPAPGLWRALAHEQQAAALRPVPVQRRAEPGSRPLIGAADTRRLAADGLSAGGTRLPYLDAIQASFGSHDVSSVRAHVGGRAGQASEQMRALGYASGESVAFLRPPDLHTAAHEAAHVVQQRGGVQLPRGVGQAGDAYERHADDVAALVVRGKSAQQLLDTMAAPGGESPRHFTEPAWVRTQVWWSPAASSAKGLLA